MEALAGQPQRMAGMGWEGNGATPTSPHQGTVELRSASKVSQHSFAEIGNPHEYWSHDGTFLTLTHKIGHVQSTEPRILLGSNCFLSPLPFRSF